MVSVSALCKRYGDFMLDVSFHLPPGRISGLVGRNGAGKSTTIKAILGLLPPDSGRVTVFGKDACALSGADKQRIGIALSDSGFSGYLNLRDIAGILARMYPSLEPQQFLRRCGDFGLPQNKPLQQFSTGMKAKLRVLTAISHSAELLVLDEPTAGMDVEARTQILDLLRDYVSQREDCSILITSHIATDLEGLCDDIYLIDQGRILLHEDTDLILSDYGVLKLNEADYALLDREHILKARKTDFGYCCLTDQKRFYQENYPALVMESCGIDQMILMLCGGN